MLNTSLPPAPLLSANPLLVDLNPTFLPQIMKLQAIVYDALPDDRKNVIIPKKQDEFHARMTALGKMVGLAEISDGQKPPELVAYATLALPTNKWPVADMVIAPGKLPCKPEELGVLQNAVVHPEKREKHLHRMLIQARLDLCQKAERPHVMSEVAAYNPKSLKGLLDFGFKVIASGVDPDDGCKLFYVHKKLGENPKAAYPAKPAHSLDPVTEFEKIGKLLDQGYHGISITRTDVKDGYKLNLAYPLHPC